MKLCKFTYYNVEILMVYIKPNVLLWVLLLSLKTSAQSSFTYAGGAHTAGIARAGVNLSGIEGAYCNQAGLAEIRHFSMDVSVEKRFNLGELGVYSFASAYNVRDNILGIMMSGFGFSDYTEQKLGVIYARKLSNIILVGGQIGVLRYNIPGYDRVTTASLEMGMIVKLSDEFSWAGHIFAPGDTEIKGDFFKGTRLRLGGKYMPSKKVAVMAEVEKRVDRFPSLMVGAVYQVHTLFGISIGVNPRLRLVGFGFALSFKEHYRVIAAAGINDVIGNTPAASLQYIR